MTVLNDTVLLVSPNGQPLIKYGIDVVAHKTRNFRLNTSDGESLGVWHILCVLHLAFFMEIVNWADV